MLSFALKVPYAVRPGGLAAGRHAPGFDGIDAASFRARSGFPERRRYFEMV
jgi:hypothetical protein